MTVFQRVRQVEAELANVNLSQDLRDEVSGLCATCYGNKHDILTEHDEFYETPALPGSEMNQVRVALICRWLSDDFLQLNAVVQRLRKISKQDPARVTAYVLVAESAVNVLRSFTVLRDATDRCLQAVASKSSSSAVFDTNFG